MRERCGAVDFPPALVHTSAMHRAIRAVGRLLAVPLLLLSLVPSASHAQGDGPLGFRFRGEKLVIGEWVTYWNYLTRPGGVSDTTWQRIAVVDADSFGHKPAHWIEITYSGPPRVVLKTLVLDEVATSQAPSAGGVRALTAAAAKRLADPQMSYIKRLILRRGTEEPIEMRLPAGLPVLRAVLGSGGPDLPPDRVARDDSLDRGVEEVLTTLGTKRGHRTSFITVMDPHPSDTTYTVTTFATDVWVSEDIPITGVVRTVSRMLQRPPEPGQERERSEMVLAEYGLGARSQITGRVRLINPPRSPRDIRH